MLLLFEPVLQFNDFFLLLANEILLASTIWIDVFVGHVIIIKHFRQSVLAVGISDSIVIQHGLYLWNFWLNPVYVVSVSNSRSSWLVVINQRFVVGVEHLFVLTVGSWNLGVLFENLVTEPLNTGWFLTWLQFLLANLNVDLVDFALRKALLCSFAFEFTLQLIYFGLKCSLIMRQIIKFFPQSLLFAIANVQSFDCRLDVLLFFCLLFIKHPSFFFILLCTGASMLFQLFLKLLIYAKFLDFKLPLFVFLL